MIRADNEPESISKASGDDIVVNIDKMNENAGGGRINEGD